MLWEDAGLASSWLVAAVLLVMLVAAATADRAAAAASREPGRSPSSSEESESLPKRSAANAVTVVAAEVAPARRGLTPGDLRWAPLVAGRSSGALGAVALLLLLLFSWLRSPPLPAALLVVGRGWGG